MIPPPPVPTVAHVPRPAPVPDADQALALAVAVRRSTPATMWGRREERGESTTRRPGGAR